MYATTFAFRGFYKWCYERSVCLITFYVQICMANRLLDIAIVCACQLFSQISHIVPARCFIASTCVCPVSML